MTSTAASGIGGDIGTIVTDWHTVHAEGVVFVDGSVNLRFTGDHNQWMMERTTVVVDAHLNDHILTPTIGYVDRKSGKVIEGEARPNYPSAQDGVTVLGGFDLLSNNSSKKPITFGVHTERPTYDPVADTFTFDVRGELEMGCDSAECQDDEVDYSLTVRWVLAYESNDDDVDAMEVTWGPDVIDNHSWNTIAEPLPNPGNHTISGQSSLWPTATLGMSGFSLDLDNEHHMIGLWDVLEPGVYDAGTGRLPFEQWSHFKQWQPVMYTAPLWLITGFGVIPIAYRDAGSAVHVIEPVLLQFANAEVTSHQRTHVIEWNGNDASAASGDAEAISTSVDRF